MDIEKNKIISAPISYWVNINNDIENYIKLHYMSYISTNATEGKDHTS